MQLRFIRPLWFGFSLFAFVLRAIAADTFSIGSYNVANYLDAPGGGSRPVKSPEGRAKVREMIRALDVDVLGLVEMGSRSALEELRTSLKQEGLDYPHWEHVTGYDTNIHVAVLSKFPISARRPHTKDSFLLNGRRFQVSRGFAEVDVQVSEGYTFTLLVAHLKSKRPVPEANEADWREQEAIILREKVDAIFARNANANFALIGDLNDTKDSRPIRAVVGRSGAKQLFDTRPAERNGDTRIPPRKGYSPANISWTHFYGKEDTYSRIDYILLSQGMVKEWVEDETYVLAKSGWGEASDHRPVKATFHAKDK